jgi:flagellar biosynthesis protein FlhA
VNARTATYGLAAIVLSIVLIFVVPLPPWVLDGLLAFDIMGAGIVLLIAITVDDPLEFAAFPPALLIATLFRLALDVSATRLILTQGHLPGGAGSLIPAFGAFVVRGNLVVGLIVLAILIAIQFLVIAAGSQRVAEVAARFTLDAMPGKQMAIDAEVHAGALDAEGARRKRALVQKEADFYGAMDGAGKFVKGDAIASSIVVVLNVLGGVVVGLMHGMNPLDALNTFAILSIGNALATALPAFLLSASMGLMVTRVTADASLGADLVAQVAARPEVLRAGAAFAFTLALVPALPHPPFALIGCALAGAAQLAIRRRRGRATEALRANEAARRAAIRRPETALALVGVDALSIEIGADLAALLVSPQADALLDRIGEVRRALASDLGFVLPGVRLRDELAREGYGIRVRDVLVAEGRLRLGALLAVADPPVLASLGGERVREPVYGMDASWIAPSEREAAATAGALVFDPVSIVGSHLAEVAREHASELVGRQEVQTLLEHLRASVPTLVKEIGGEALPLALVQRVVEGLLRERIWPRDPVAVLEALVDAAPAKRDAAELIEAVRKRVVPAQIARRGLRVLEPLVLAPAFEEELRSTWCLGGSAVPDPRNAAHLRECVERYLARIPRPRAALVCTGALRVTLSEVLRRLGLPLDVYSFAELPSALDLRPAEVIEAPLAVPAPAARASAQATFEQSGQRPVIVKA